MNDNNFWKKEINRYLKYRKYKNPFSYYYPEKKASMGILVNYFADFIDMRNAKILELGIGTGLALVLAIKKGAICTGIDQSAEACKFAGMIKEDYLIPKEYKTLILLMKISRNGIQMKSLT